MASETLDRLLYQFLRKGDISFARFKDNIPLNFGDSKDVAVQWTGSLLSIIPLADDTGAINIGNGTKDMDVKIFLGTTGQYVDFNVGNANIKMIGTPKGATLEMTPGVGGAGLKIHTHSNVNNSGGATYDYTYINEFKGEFVSTSGTMVGIGADYTLSGSGTGAMCASSGYAKLLTGITMSGAATPTAGILTGGQFFANAAGTLNGAGVEMMGLYAGIDYNTGATLTAADFIAAICGEYRSNVVLSSGTSSILRLVKGGTAGIAITYGINLECTDGSIGIGLHMSPFDGYAIYLGEWDCSVVGNGWALGQSGHGRSVFFGNSDGGVDPTRTITAVHSRFGVTKDYTDTFSTTALIGEFYNNGFNIVATSDNCNMSGVYGYIEVATGGNAQIGGASGKVIYLAGLESWVELGADVDLLATGKACGLKLSNNFKAGWAIGTGHTYAIYAETVDTAGFEFFFGTNHVGNGLEADTNSMGVAATAWALKIDVNGATGYIPVYDNSSWT